MRYDEFKKFFDLATFQPVRIFFSRGHFLDVRHPEQVMISHSLFMYMVGPKNRLPEHIGWQSLIHVVKVVPLSAVRRRKTRKKRTA